MKTIRIGLVVVLTAVGAIAANRPVQLSLTPDIALFDRSETIEGLTLSIWGENHQRALALGIINGSVGSSSGLSLGLLLNYAEDYTGVQWAPVNYASGEFVGWQNGFVNYAGRLTGLQLGLINFAEMADTGVQVGFINVIRENTSWFAELPEELAPAMVFVNWRF